MYTDKQLKSNIVLVRRGNAGKCIIIDTVGKLNQDMVYSQGAMYDVFDKHEFKRTHKMFKESMCDNVKAFEAAIRRLMNEHKRLGTYVPYTTGQYEIFA